MLNRFRLMLLASFLPMFFALGCGQPSAAKMWKVKIAYPDYSTWMTSTVHFDGSVDFTHSNEAVIVNNLEKAFLVNTARTLKNPKKLLYHYFSGVYTIDKEGYSDGFYRFLLTNYADKMEECFLHAVIENPTQGQQYYPRGGATYLGQPVLPYPHTLWDTSTPPTFATRLYRDQWKSSYWKDNTTQMTCLRAVLNPESPVLREAMLQYCLTKLRATPDKNYIGIFFDEMMGHLWCGQRYWTYHGSMVGYTPIQSGEFVLAYPDNRFCWTKNETDDWYLAARGQLEYLVNGLNAAGYKTFFNGGTLVDAPDSQLDERRDQFASIGWGNMQECFIGITPNSSAITYDLMAKSFSNNPVIYWKKCVDHLDKWSRTKHVWVTGGHEYNPAEPAGFFKDSFLFQYCSFLMGANDCAMFYFARGLNASDPLYPKLPGKPYGSYQHFVWFDWYDLDLGSPLGRYYEHSPGVFRRDFENAVVLVNLAQADRTINFDSPMCIPEGGFVSSVTLSHTRGIVLLKGVDGCRKADMNADGRVDSDDYTIFSACMNSSEGAVYSKKCLDTADLNYDGKINSDDYTSFAVCYNAPRLE